MIPQEFLVRVEAMCDEMLALRQQANQAVSQADKSVSNIYHQVEFSQFNAAEGYQLAKTLQTVGPETDSIEQGAIWTRRAVP